MQTPPKKKKPGREKRLALLILLILLAAGAAAFFIITTKHVNAPVVVSPVPNTQVMLFTHEQSEVATVHVITKNYGSYELVRKNDTLRLANDPDIPLNNALVNSILSAAAILSAEDTITDNWQAQQGLSLSDFGLDPPQVEVTVSYIEGDTITFSIGDLAPLNQYYYMVVAGDNHLYITDGGYISAFDIDENSLRSTSTFSVDKSRMNAITLLDPAGNVTSAWEKTMELGWRITAPISYPANATAITNLCANIATIRLGAHVASKADCDLAAYGLDQPATLRVNLAAGTRSQVNDDGTFSTQTVPVETITLSLGSTIDEYSQYIMVDDKIYLSSRLLLAFLDTLNIENMLEALPTNIALDLVDSLTVKANNETNYYQLAREPRVLENNELETDTSGNIIYDILVTLNGETMEYSTFEARYETFATTKMSGRLPDNYIPQGTPHTVFTITTTLGSTRTIALYAYDAFHDAVSVDNTCVNYLFKGNLTF